MSTTAQRPAASREAAAKPTHSLFDDVRYLPSVGPKRAEHLQRLGINTIGDLLEHLPARHERQEFRTILNVEEGMVATVVGRIAAVRVQGRRGGARISATLVDNTGRMSLAWFNAPYVADKLENGLIVRATGKVREFMQLPQMINPKLEVLGQDAQPVDESQPARLAPVYPATLELSSSVIGRLISSNLEWMLAQVQERYPPAFLHERRLMGRREALESMHRPRDERQTQAARMRLAFDELLLMQIAVTLSRHHRTSRESAVTLKCTPEIDRRIRARFPFKLTRGQDGAVAQIVADLAQARPMNRLLQGDVGCGKTAVAVYAALTTVANRRQVAFMAPTELLAEQHFRSIDKYLSGSRVRYALLVGGMAAKARGQLLTQIETGEMDIVVGTHALLQQDVKFDRIALAIVDEQHRFGVRQRATLRSKGPAPHYLVMTATPIPRTLALTVFGDLDVTTIEELPPGRTPIQTRLCGPRNHEAAWEFVRTQLSSGRQAYVVYPLIDESDKAQIKAATTEYQRLADREFSRWRVDLLHGRMNGEERAAVMQRFAAGHSQVLVATTVIEVGIDVPNAACMVIEHAERYGLSQLHQLRGRVGRGAEQGYCFLLTDSPAAAENERLSVLARTTDGFRIAEEDLRLRGPGEVAGTRQHGLPELRVADLIDDAELLRLAQRDATRIVREYPRLQRPQYTVLRAAILGRYRETLGMVGIG